MFEVDFRSWRQNCLFSNNNICLKFYLLFMEFIVHYNLNFFTITRNLFFNSYVVSSAILFNTTGNSRDTIPYFLSYYRRIVTWAEMQLVRVIMFITNGKLALLINSLGACVVLVTSVCVGKLPICLHHTEPHALTLNIFSEWNASP